MAPVGIIQQGERIIDKGDIVTTRLATVLKTYEEIADERGKGTISQHYYPLAGQILYMVILFGALYGYLCIFRRDYFDDDRTVLFIMTIMGLFTLFAFAMQAAFRTGLYITPFTIVPILILVFPGLAYGIFLPSYPCVDLRYHHIIRAGIRVHPVHSRSGSHRLTQRPLPAQSAHTHRRPDLHCLRCLLCGRRDHAVRLALKTEGRIFGCFAINAILISFSYVLMFLVERVFGFTSRVTLVELSDINNPLLRELSEECPGTFNHSMAVSNLASAAAGRIGANVQLVRTGALYHDIGKIKNPAFYTENQHGVNPHDALDRIRSARIVTGHVREGLALAEKAKLPRMIRRFISEHHGAGMARYFYTTYCNAHPDENVDPAPFSYPARILSQKRLHC